jgi:hypothetical protein
MTDPSELALTLRALAVAGSQGLAPLLARARADAS